MQRFLASQPASHPAVITFRNNNRPGRRINKIKPLEISWSAAAAAVVVASRKQCGLFVVLCAICNYGRAINEEDALCTF